MIVPHVETNPGTGYANKLSRVVLDRQLNCARSQEPELTILSASTGTVDFLLVAMESSSHSWKRMRFLQIVL